MNSSVASDDFTLNLASASKQERDSLFLSPGIKIPAKKLAAPKFLGQQGDKVEKAKKIKYILTISY